MTLLNANHVNKSEIVSYKPPDVFIFNYAKNNGTFQSNQCLSSLLVNIKGFTIEYIMILLRFNFSKTKLVLVSLTIASARLF